MAGDPTRCQHDRTPATCEACAHADALADPTRAGVTRDELYPVPVPVRQQPQDEEPTVVAPPARKRTARRT